MQHEARFKYLFYRHLEKTATVDERVELTQYTTEDDFSVLLKELIDESIEVTWDSAEQSPESINRVFDSVMEKAGETEVKVIPMLPRTWTRIAAAAIIIILLSVGGYFIYNKDKQSGNIVSTPTQELKNDVKAPSLSKATITLADGSVIPLDSLNKGLLAKQQGVNVIKNADGTIAYDASSYGPSIMVHRPVFNTLNNPRGSSTVSLTLSDGSKVWLNSESTITYPTAFKGNERQVQITGEGYFEIAKVSGKKFIVKSNGVDIEVLGTHFNVNSYENEAETKVTLLEGLLRLSLNYVKPSVSSVVKIIPGQQAQINKSTAQRINVTKDISLEEVTAWKEGLFHFESADLKTILTQFARWYDIDVIYKGKVSSEKYFTIIKRSTTLVNVLKSLGANGVTYRIEEKKLYVESS